MAPGTECSRPATTDEPGDFVGGRDVTIANARLTPPTLGPTPTTEALIALFVAEKPCC
jgi:hypothetical protein